LGGFQLKSAQGRKLNSFWFWWTEERAGKKNQGRVRDGRVGAETVKR